MARVGKVFIKELSDKKLLELQADVDRLVRQKRLQQVLKKLAEQSIKDRRVVLLQQQLEAEIKVMNLRKVILDETIEELEAVLEIDY